MKTVLWLFGILLPALLFAQPPDTLWTRSYAIPGICKDIVQTHDGGFALIMNTGWYDETDTVRLLKTDSVGSLLWDTVFTGISLTSSALKESSDGGFMLAGSSQDDFWLARTDSLGNAVWDPRTYGTNDEETCSSACLMANGDLILGGEMITNGSSVYRAVIMRISSEGNLLWRWESDSTSDEGVAQILAIEPDRSNGFVTAGLNNYSDRPTFAADAWIQSFHTDQSIAWSHQRTWGQENFNKACAITLIPESGFLVAGWAGYRPNSIGRLTLSRFDSSGTLVHEYVSRSSSFQSIRGLHFINGTVVIACNIEQDNPSLDDAPFILGFNANGDTLWSRMLWWDNYDYLHASAPTADNGLAVVMEARIDSSYTSIFKLCRFAPVPALSSQLGKQPDQFALSQNYPNPFNPTTVISFALPKSGMTSLKVYDLLGREVTTLISRSLAAGEHQVTFDASRLSSGVYFYRLQSGSFSATRKMLLLK